MKLDARKLKAAGLAPDTEFAVNLLLIKHSGLRKKLNRVRKFKDRNGLTPEVQKIVTEYFQEIYAAGHPKSEQTAAMATGEMVGQAILILFPKMLFETWKNKDVLRKVQQMLNRTETYLPGDPDHPIPPEAYSIFSKLSGVI